MPKKTIIQLEIDWLADFAKRLREGRPIDTHDMRAYANNLDETCAILRTYARALIGKKKVERRARVTARL